MSKHKTSVGVSIDTELLHQFRIILDKNHLRLSPILNELIRYFIRKSKELDNG